MSRSHMSLGYISGGPTTVTIAQVLCLWYHSSESLHMLSQLIRERKQVQRSDPPGFTASSDWSPEALPSPLSTESCFPAHSSLFSPAIF